jgi:Arc/MetJ family transcription regulator
MRRISVILDERLVQRAKRVTGLTTSRELVDYALRELVRRGNQRALLKLRGKIDWEG